MFLVCHIKIRLKIKIKTDKTQTEGSRRSDQSQARAHSPAQSVYEIYLGRSMATAKTASRAIKTTIDPGEPLFFVPFTKTETSTHSLSFKSTFGVQFPARPHRILRR